MSQTTQTSENCTICAGIGWYVLDVPATDPRFGKLQRCTCRAEEDRQRAYQRAVRASDLSEYMLAEMTFANFDTTHAPMLPEAFYDLQAFAVDPQGWRVLLGTVGMGKTHLLVATAGALIAQGRHVVYCVAPRLLERLRQSFNERSLSERDRLHVEHLEVVDVLLLDDLGAESETTWTEDVFYRMLDARYVNRRPTIIASNIDVTDWPYRLSSRAQDARLSRIHILAGDDYRTSSAARAASQVERKGARRGR